MDAKKLIDQVSEVCPLPASVHRVMAQAQDPNAALDDMADTIATDPALAAEVMRLATTPAFVRRYPPTDIRSAVLTIGLAELRNMAGAMAMLVAFRSENELSLKIHDHAVHCANIGFGLARQLGTVKPTAAFVCGLLSEIGALACLAVDADYYLTLREAAGSDLEERIRREEARYGVTSMRIGASLLDRNGLAYEIVAAVGGLDDGEPMLAATTAIARHAVSLLASADAEEPFEQMRKLARQYAINISAEALEGICETAGISSQEALSKTRQ